MTYKQHLTNSMYNNILNVFGIQHEAYLRIQMDSISVRKLQALHDEISSYYFKHRYVMDRLIKGNRFDLCREMNASLQKMHKGKVSFRNDLSLKKMNVIVNRYIRIINKANI